jgi:hypothetical protein
MQDVSGDRSGYQSYNGQSISVSMSQINDKDKRE